jgi:hypothetical protein
VVSGCCGEPNICCGFPISWIRPLWKKATRSETSRAKAISWVTTILVMPSFASRRMVSSGRNLT